MPKPANLLFFLSDNHARGMMGSYGHPAVKTPTLDALAASGARFANAYSASPICCPARASIATGRYPHQTGYWDNAIVYDGRVASWMHRLREAGYETASVGKLHFRATEDDNGFDEEIVPMHILNGKGGVAMLLRWSDEEPVNKGQWELYLDKSGIGSTHYQDYDVEISNRAIAWLEAKAQRSGKPWALFVSYVSSHPPFTVPQRLWDMYDDAAMALPVGYRPEERSEHPADQYLRRTMGFKAMTDPSALRRIARAYCALTTHLDEQIARVLGAADRTGLRDGARIVYTSDHGEALGAHGLFGKYSLYEPSVGVPLLFSGPDVPRGVTIDEPVSHVDLFATLVAGAGGRLRDADRDIGGESLWPVLGGAKRPRPVFAEYHAAGSRTGMSMIRVGNEKLIYHVGAPAQLFDLEADPDELRDLATTPAGRSRAAELERALRKVCDPEAVDRRAKADQKAKAEFWGGNEAILKEGLLVYTPPPGVKAEIEPATPASR
ncbi:MAG: sulfatase-like hydrolase/transferase [Alphaproteobacteria bacterium]|nr:sulfatase-like hydrolase/transferase [Alphaproteobacteria bacterium]